MRDSKPYRIAISGTFDVENYGDLLFPLLAEHELSQRLGRIELVPFSYHAKARGPWAYDVKSIADFASEVETFDALIIGGGHIIRFDKYVAEGYGPPSDAIHHPTGYWLSPALAAIAASVPVIWNAPSASLHVPHWAEQQLRVALDASAYVSVRDEISRTVLMRVAPDASVVVAPDTAFGLAGLLRDGNVSHPPVRSFTAPYLVCHAYEAIRPLVEAVRADPRFAGHQLVEIPIGPILGDRVGLLSDDGRREFSIEGWTHPLEIASLVAGSSGVLTRSLHLSVTALAFGKPVMVLDLPDDSKYELLARSSRVFVGASDEAREQFARATKADTLCELARAGATETSAHWDRVAEEIVRGDGRRRSRAAIYEHFFRVHTHLEREEGLRDEHTRARADLETLSERLETLTARLAIQEQAFETERSERARLEEALVASQSKIGRLEDDADANHATIERLEVLARILRARVGTSSVFAKLASRFERFRDVEFRLTKPASQDVHLVRASGLFDSAAYLARTRDVVANADELIARYLAAPVVAGNDPGPRFDAAYYLRTNPDVAASGLHPLIHYLRFGVMEGRAPRSTTRRHVL